MNTILNEGVPWIPLVVWDAAWKSVVLLTGGGVVAVALRRGSAAGRHLVWTLTMAGTLGLPLAALALPSWSWPVLPAGVIVMSSRGALTALRPTLPGLQVQELRARTDPGRSEPQAKGTMKEMPSGAASGNDEAAMSPAQEVANLPLIWLMVAWAAGVLGMLAIPLSARG